MRSIEDRLADILKYEMDEDEARAFKLCLLWEKLAEKEFPNYACAKLRHTGDPRKSYLFRHCYKLGRETKGLLEQKEYRLYIWAQLHTFSTLSDQYARIDPQILHGVKAWKRWRRWKAEYDRQMALNRNTLDATTETRAAVRGSLVKTKSFLAQRFESQPTAEGIHDVVKDRTMLRWLTFNKVTPYYVLLSPWIAQAIGDQSPEEAFGFDWSNKKANITDDVKSDFAEIFGYEWKSQD